MTSMVEKQKQDQPKTAQNNQKPTQTHAQVYSHHLS